jgi:peptidoglycan/LPS O-acetylase OafA/YrhL
MPSDPPPTDLDAGIDPRWPARLGRALAITMLQILAAALVFALFLIPASNATAEGPDDWAGFEYIIMGVLGAPIVGAIVGMIVAARMRMPLYSLYALPALLCAAAFLAPFFSATRGLELPGLPVFIGGNVLIALATVRLPRRPRAPRTEIPF